LSSLWFRTWRGDCGEWTRLLGRVLIMLTTLLLLAMPITEHLCNWDRFLRGGPDVEFSVLAWLLFAAMVVLSMHGAMLRPLAMQPARIEVATDADKMRSSCTATLCGLHTGGDSSPGRNETGFFDDLPVPVPMRI
jgi:hypothetical protein